MNENGTYDGSSWSQMLTAACVPGEEVVVYLVGGRILAGAVSLRGHDYIVLVNVDGLPDPAPLLIRRDAIQAVHSDG